MSEKNPPIQKLHSWMYTLLYPAVLGALLVAFIGALPISQKAPEEHIMSFGAFLILYFSSQHIENTLDQDSYSFPMFIFDFIELIAMFIFYALLGFVAPEYKIGGCNGYTWSHFFGLLGGAFLLPVITRFIDHKNPFHKFRAGCLSTMSIIAAVISFWGVFKGPSTEMVCLLFLLLALYFLLFVSGFVK